MNKELKRIIEYLLPYGILKKIRNKKNRDYFRNGYLEYQENKKKYEIRGYEYKTVVSVVGLGYSGSGAILDLLCEFDNCDVIGTDSNAKVLGIDHKGSFEADFLRLSGGLFDIEHYIGSDNLFQNDALINRFISLLNNFVCFREDKNIRSLFYVFFDNIVDQCNWDVDGVPYNSHLAPYNEVSSIFYIKPISKNEYYKFCQSLLKQFFLYINKNKREYLVFDQLLADNSFDMNYYFKYIPECKVIVSYRDPRDIYAMAIKHNIGWIAHENVESFICWYKRVTRNLDLESNKYLVVQFEKLVNDYENQVKRIEEYLHLNENCHSNSLKRKFFNPDLSKINVGLWKNSDIEMSDFNIIQQSLKKYCYE